MTQVYPNTPTRVQLIQEIVLNAIKTTLHKHKCTIHSALNKEWRIECAMNGGWLATICVGVDEQGGKLTLYRGVTATSQLLHYSWESWYSDDRIVTDVKTVVDEWIKTAQLRYKKTKAPNGLYLISKNNYEYIEPCITETLDGKKECYFYVVYKPTTTKSVDVVLHHTTTKDAIYKTKNITQELPTGLHLLSNAWEEKALLYFEYRDNGIQCFDETTQQPTEFFHYNEELETFLSALEAIEAM